ncbi:BQ2448_7197 [Microbotryum intermedium]|uniref:BQ2448_7197 protein n=1 Tax=Microbotryum intermedium TaxID=269621 RepID=A0A238FM88_9BASI|nr:BQ2448_7197 [Microbotryum intermedium]
MVNAPTANGTNQKDGSSTALIPKTKGDVRNRAGIASYTQHWDRNSANDTAEMTEQRKDVYTDVVNSYYDGAFEARTRGSGVRDKKVAFGGRLRPCWRCGDVERRGDSLKRCGGATELYEYGWGTSFHFCRYYKGEAFYQAIARHEHYLAAQTGIRPKMRVLDVGCGVGGPAREIARFTDAQVVGVNNNEFQVSRANKYTANAGLSDQVSFVKGDFMKLAEQFGENSFDAVYAIEATCHAPDWEGCYNQIKKVLKPGGVFGVYEWCMTDAWDPKIPHHKEIAHGIEVGDGIPEMRSIKACRTALQNVGFEILHEEDLADRDDEVKWYYPLEGDLKKCQTLWDYVIVRCAGFPWFLNDERFRTHLLSPSISTNQCWRMTRFGKFCTQNTVWALEKVGLVPKGTHDVGEALVTASVALVAGGKEKLFTPMMLFVCKKPEDK